MLVLVNAYGKKEAFFIIFRIVLELVSDFVQNGIKKTCYYNYFKTFSRIRFAYVRILDN